MPKPYTPPTGKLSTRHREFTEVVRDIRHAVACIVRWRPAGEAGKFAVTALGSGFFVSPDMFLTCNHVMNDPNNPHKDGDTYQLVARVAENGGHTLGVENVVVGTNLFLYPDCDLALLKCPPAPQRPFVAFEYGEIFPGEDVGFAGYPANELANDANGNVIYDGVFLGLAAASSLRAITRP